MFDLDRLMERARSLFSSDAALDGAVGVDAARLLGEAGFDASTLAGMAPEQIAALLDQAGLDPALLDGADLGALAESLLDEPQLGEHKAA